MIKKIFIVFLSQFCSLPGIPPAEKFSQPRAAGPVDIATETCSEELLVPSRVRPQSDREKETLQAEVSVLRHILSGFTNCPCKINKKPTLRDSLLYDAGTGTGKWGEQH